MNIQISNGKKVDLVMKHQIEDTVSQFRDIYDFKATFTCTQNIRDVKYGVEFLDDVKADFFHSLTAKLLNITERKIPDTEPDVAFLTTRVAKRNVDYWKKLRIFISYLNQTVGNVRIIEVFNLTYLFTWVDE